MRRDAGQITHAIAVPVGEAARIDLVNDRALPPLPKLLGHFSLLIMSLHAVRAETQGCGRPCSVTPPQSQPVPLKERSPEYMFCRANPATRAMPSPLFFPLSLQIISLIFLKCEREYHRY